MSMSRPVISSPSQGQDEADEAVGADVVRADVQDELVFPRRPFQILAGVPGLVLLGVSWV